MPLRCSRASAAVREWIPSCRRPRNSAYESSSRYLLNRTVVRLDAERSASRLEHWQRIVISACEQCGRSVVPEVRPPLSLDATLASLEPGTTGLTLDPAGTGQIDELLGTTTRVALAIGPEGGFTADEIKALTDAGFRGLRFAPRILRTETAPLAALSILQYARGDLGATPRL